MITSILWRVRKFEHEHAISVGNESLWSVQLDSLFKLVLQRHPQSHKQLCTHSLPWKFAWSFTQQNMTINWIRHNVPYTDYYIETYFSIKVEVLKRKLWFYTVPRLISLRYWNVTTTGRLTTRVRNLFISKE